MELQDRVAEALVSFWEERGCVRRRGCALPVPVGLMHPDAFFDVASLEAPRGSAFVQSIRRPLDGRGEDHPCRWFRHRQVVVVDVASSSDPLGVFLASLRAAGIEAADCDLRFRAHRWRTRSLGLRGVGWRVLAGGLKVARVGWLQSVVDVPRDPAPLEVTYGLERLSVLVDGQLPGSHPAEAELTRWAREVGDPADFRRRLESDLTDADRCLAAGLARPAYELAIRAVEKVDLIAAGGRLGPRQRAEMLEGIARRVVEAIRQVGRGDVATGAPATAAEHGGERGRAATPSAEGPVVDGSGDPPPPERVARPRRRRKSRSRRKPAKIEDTET